MMKVDIMTEKLEFKKIKIPDGILHDQDLKDVFFDKNKRELVLTFETYLFSDYIGNEFCERYKDYKKCRIYLQLSEGECDNYGVLKTAVKNNAYKSKIISLSEFEKEVNSEIKNNKAWKYIQTVICPNWNEAQIVLCGFFSKRKYRRYSMCVLNLSVKEIIWDWK